MAERLLCFGRLLLLSSDLSLSSIATILYSKNKEVDEAEGPISSYTNLRSVVPISHMPCRSSRACLGLGAPDYLLARKLVLPIK